LQKSFNVIPAQAGIQVFLGPLDRGCHQGGGFVEFCKRLRIYRIYRKTTGRFVKREAGIGRSFEFASRFLPLANVPSRYP